MHRRARLRTAALATALALLAALLLPSLARAWFAPGSEAWAVVCTAQGTRPLPVADDAQATGSLHNAWEHCPLCAHHGAAPPRAAALANGPWTTHPVHARPPAMDTRPPCGAWPAPRPRGPPVPTPTAHATT